jgi:hypothetical protein
MIRKVPTCSCLDQEIQSHYPDGHFGYICNRNNEDTPYIELWVSIKWDDKAKNRMGTGHTAELPAHYCTCCGQMYEDVEVPDDY